MLFLSVAALAVLSQLCDARYPGFSYHDDLLAYPQVRSVIARQEMTSH